MDLLILCLIAAGAFVVLRDRFFKQPPDVNAPLTPPSDGNPPPPEGYRHTSPWNP